MTLSAFGPVRMPIEAYIYRRKGKDKDVGITSIEPPGNQVK